MMKKELLVPEEHPIFLTDQRDKRGLLLTSHTAATFTNSSRYPDNLSFQRSNNNKKESSYFCNFVWKAWKTFENGLKRTKAPLNENTCYLCRKNTGPVSVAAKMVHRKISNVSSGLCLHQRGGTSTSHYYLLTTYDYHPSGSRLTFRMCSFPR